MGAYTLRRILQMIPVVLGTTFLIYTLVWALPTDPFAGRCGERPCPQAYVQLMTEKFNLDDPLPWAYLQWLGGLFTGNLGETYTGLLVWDQVASAFPNTLKLATVAIMFEIVVGITAGVFAGLNRGRFIDNLVLLSTLALISIPVFVLGTTLQYLLGIQFPIFSPTVPPGAPWSSLILPGFVLGALSMAYVARLVRSSILENMRSDYVRTATAKGLARRRVIGLHVMRNSLIPVVTFIGADFGALMAGAIITEGIFNINGVGNLVYRGILNQEGALVTSVVTLFVLIFLVVNLIVDLLYGFLDPRIRYE
ncbi:MAG: ABC transporter permease [Thermoanaerobaculaceae bacterium]|jgi:oligopeptide transport system permease protein|nr:ABC transporter permease [Thermoanaerobaculaceae bacterium]